jgi:NAD(P)-dependent dehydrogenase (short-subunit alcohol dehydrogenase family)
MNGGAPATVVTRGNRGIGFEICRQLASLSAQVALTAPETGNRPGFVCSYESGIVSSRR